MIHRRDDEPARGKVGRKPSHLFGIAARPVRQHHDGKHRSVGHGIAPGVKAVEQRVLPDQHDRRIVARGIPEMQIKPTRSMRRLDPHHMIAGAVSGSAP